jgi:small-conductance mechanosensitive channel
MSLELEIKKLTEVMIELNATMQALRSPQQNQHQAETEPAPQPEPTNTPTAEDLKQLCLSLVRKNPALKAKIKSVLDQFGASKATDVKDTDMPVVIEQIKALGV